MSKPSDVDIAEKFENAVQRMHRSETIESNAYTEGVRDALGWVLGEYDAPEIE